MPFVFVPAARFERWCHNFTERHGSTAFEVVDRALTGSGEDGSTFVARLPFDQTYSGVAEPVELLRALETPARWAVLLVRKGGFAIALMHHDAMAESKTGQRHVQGKTKKGGSSSGRFARRRDNQARQAYEAAAGHAVRILGEESELPTVVGGDHSAVDEVLADPKLAQLKVVGPWLAVPDPRRAVLEAAVRDACSIQVQVTNA